MNSPSTRSRTVATHNDPISQLIERLAQQRSSRTRWTRAVMLVQAALMAGLGALGWWQLAGADTATTVAAGIRLGAPAVAALLLTAVAIVLAAPCPHRALRRVALAAATLWAAIFVAGAAYYPDPGGMWQTNAATAAMFATIALAAFAEFVVLNSDAFDPSPGTRP